MIYAEIVAFSLALLICLGSTVALVRLNAARVNAVSSRFADGTRKRFGLPPHNLFEYHRGIGWRRIAAKTRHGPIFDERPHVLRVRDEQEHCRKRRRAAFYCTARIVVGALLVAFLDNKIDPASNHSILGTINPYGVWEAIEGAFSTASDLNGYILAYMLVAISAMVVISFLQLLPLLGDELIYQLGFQTIQGARVFDLSPEKIIGNVKPTAAPRRRPQQRLLGVDEE